jgi:Ser/Thr protein kinase RdoA (MazF antagonist)
VQPGDVLGEPFASGWPGSAGTVDVPEALPIDAARLLAEHYGRVPTSITTTPRGHTNRSAFVDCGGEALVLRCSWAGKPDAAIAREERLLAYLAAEAPELPVPRIVPTLRGGCHVRVPEEARFVHLFRRLPGEPRYGWKGPCSTAHARAAGAVLARLHAALRGARDVPGDDPLGIPRERLLHLDRDAARDAALRLDRALGDAMPRFFALAEAMLDDARGLPDEGPVQWVHGDFQLENLLFCGGEVSGVVDFDGARAGTPALDLAFALFSVARCGHVERRFTFDDALFRAGLEGYQSAARRLGIPGGGSQIRGRTAILDRLERLYCLDQALMHLDAHARGIWRLAVGIGFLPCVRRVLA